MNGVHNDKYTLRHIHHSTLQQNRGDLTPTVQQEGEDVNEKERELSDDDSVSSEFMNIPQGCMFDQLRPRSPTAVTDFPQSNVYPMTVQLAETLHLQVSSKRKLLTIASTDITLEPMVMRFDRSKRENK